MTDNNTAEEIRDPQGLLAAYEQAKADLVALREKEKEARAEIERIKAEYLPSEGADDKWRTRAKNEAVKNALAAQGIKNPERVLRLLDLEDLDFNDADELDGLEDRITKAQSEFPEVFDAKTRAGKSRADIHAQGAAKQQLTGSQAQVAALRRTQ